MAFRGCILGLFLAALSCSGCSAGATPAPAAASGDAARRNATVLFQRGRQAADRGDTVRAEQYLAMALDNGFDEERILPVMLRVCLSSSRLRAALNYAEPYLREHPNDRSLRYLVATIHFGLGLLDDARIDLNHLLRLDPNDADAQYLLGVLESGAKMQQAAEHFRKYLELAPKGEHAVEARSRLTDLSVRADLSQSPALASEGTVVPRVESTTQSSVASEPAQVAGFGSEAGSRSLKPSHEDAP